MANNLDLYEKVRRVPDTAKKTIKAGNLKGYTDINPIWRIKTLTENFGVCGFGWYTEIVEKWTETGAKNELIQFVIINLYVKVGNEWSKPIQGTGGSIIINAFSTGLKSNDEALKMAETDAISVCCKKIGIGADVYWERDSNKNAIKEPAEKITDAQLKRLMAIAGNKKVTDEQLKKHIKDTWNKDSKKDLTIHEYNLLIKKLEATK